MNEAIHVPSVPPVATDTPERMAFVGKRIDFRRLIVRGGLLELVTLGFYRFWLTTDMRRHMWSHTAVEGDSFEYTGRAMELLIGFLIAMAILIPVYLAYFLLGLEAERLQAFASVPLIAFLYLFGQFAIYRARRYRMSRTVWRGVRFWMTGSGWAYALRAGLWGIFVLLTLGLVLPWRDAALERYKMRHSHYGSVPGRFEGTGWEFFKRGWWIWLIGMGMLAAVVAAAGIPIAFMVQSESRANAMEMMVWVGLGVAVAFMLIMVVMPFLYGAFKAVQWKWWAEGLRFGEVKAQSSLRRGQLIGLYWAAIGWSLLFMTIFGTVTTSVVALVAGGLSDGASEAEGVGNFANSPVAIALGIVIYLLMIIAINMVIRLYLVHDVWQRVVRSVSLTGLDSVREVEARGSLATALGEGIADGLDVGGF